MKVPEQIAILVAVNKGAFDEIPLSDTRDIEEEFRSAISERMPELEEMIRSGDPLSDEAQDKIVRIAGEIVQRPKHSWNRKP